MSLLALTVIVLGIGQLGIDEFLWKGGVLFFGETVTAISVKTGGSGERGGECDLVRGWIRREGSDLELENGIVSVVSTVSMPVVSSPEVSPIESIVSNNFRIWDVFVGSVLEHFGDA